MQPAHLVPSSNDLMSAFTYGSVLQSTINAANLFRAQTGNLTFPVTAAPLQPPQPEPSKEGNSGKSKISPFDPEALVPLPFQLQEYNSLGSTVWKRNERERYRVRCVNEAYESLRQCLPYSEDEKRLSKVETLRLAILYIQHMQMMLTRPNHDLECDCFEAFQACLLEQEARRNALR
uniref:BHLH domain-containing protein n=1 Tax=Panagrellus redivivus TaxID=6233 RepID=A0A7E4V9R2_PANRE